MDNKTPLIFGTIGIIFGVVGIVFWVGWIHMIVDSYIALMSMFGIYFSDIPYGTWRLYLILAVLLGGITVSVYLLRYRGWYKLLSIINLIVCASGIIGILLWQIMGSSQILVNLTVFGGELFIHTYFIACILTLILGVISVCKYKSTITSLNTDTVT